MTSQLDNQINSNQDNQDDLQQNNLDFPNVDPPFKSSDASSNNSNDQEKQDRDLDLTEFLDKLSKTAKCLHNCRAIGYMATQSMKEDVEALEKSRKEEQAKADDLCQEMLKLCQEEGTLAAGKGSKKDLGSKAAPFAGSKSKMPDAKDQWKQSSSLL